ncbi:membrane hypothetical protein [Bradyrhizobium sp. ORS 375]|uniref:hypothetical protein n=1 Tax=Bradyrhizobium sp. (strain ORS 375) TaxID=566679 RepID=UPI0002408611|nr:hypothetical protein [Bradyrhizobium sp. ORS 375]CCD95823.1 membrane hypothetical protein [Bradyrhizobium sp. ORS 375]
MVEIDADDRPVQPLPGRYRLTRLMQSFGVLHSANTAANILYSLALLLTLSRVLPREDYAIVVFLTAISVYVQPLDQVVGRVLFAELRQSFTVGKAPLSYVKLLLASQMGVIAAASFGVPALMSLWQGGTYTISNALYLLFALMTNFWAFDLQSSSFAVDLSSKFVRWSLLHRSCQFILLGVLWVSGSFLLFAALAASTLTIFSAFAFSRLIQRIGTRALTEAMVPWTGRFHVARTSLLSGCADLMVLNVPYAAVSFAYGVGPTLVIFDSVMKVARLVMAGSRTLAEIALPQHSRLVVASDPAAANRLFHQLVALCVLASAIPAAVVALDTPLVFSLLLGHNNVVPASAGPVAALIIIATGLYQPASLLMSFQSDPVAIRRFAQIVGAAGTVSLGTIMVLKPGPVGLLWDFLALLICAGLAALVYGRSRPVPRTMPENTTA